MLEFTKRNRFLILYTKAIARVRPICNNFNPLKCLHFLYMLSLYSTATPMHLMSVRFSFMTQLRHHQVQEPFQDPPALGQDDLLCASIATYTSSIGKHDAEFCNYLFINRILL